MPVRWYLLPIETVIAADGTLMRGPKYLRWRGNTAGLDVPWGLMDYGLMDACIAWANVTTGQHNGLAANADVRHIALNSGLDSVIGAAVVQSVRDNLEALHIPGQWVQATDSFRTVLRTMMGLFLFAQRVHGKFGIKALPDGYTLNSTWSELPTGARQFLLDTADELGIDTSGATGSVTLRQIFKAFADAWGSKPIYVGGIEL